MLSATELQLLFFKAKQLLTVRKLRLQPILFKTYLVYVLANFHLKFKQCTFLANITKQCSLLSGDIEQTFYGTQL